MTDSTSNSAELVATRDLSGQNLGDYELIRRLGRGGMADVYLAKQTSLGRQVAVKILRPGLAADEKYLRRFHQEARAAASLVHANIVQIHEVGCHEGLHYIVQEYVPGQNVKQFLQRNGPVDAKLAMRVLRQVAAALHRSAQQQIIHRDIKPENIMLSTTGDVKVADFGLAQVAQDGKGLDLTQVGVTLGTPLYMSPEQVEGQAVDPRSDIYSLGVTAYHMLTGHPPFQGDTALSVAVQHLKREPARLEQLRQDLPPGICRIVHKMLEKDRAERHQSAAEILKELREVHIEGAEDEWLHSADEWTDSDLRALADTRLEATSQLAAVMQSQTLARSQRIRRRILVALTVGVAILVGALIGWWNRPASLLHVHEDQLPPIPKMATASMQYFYAMLDPSEEKLASVELYFPPQEAHVNRYYGLLARRRLADYFLAREELDKALEAYVELADVAEGGEDGFRAVGLAGQAAVHSRLGRTELAAEKLAQAFPLVSRLDVAELPGLLEQLGTDLGSILFQQLPLERQRMVLVQLTPPFRQSLLEQVEPALRSELTRPRTPATGGRGGRGGPGRP
jgi:eukaryotic-like serine/threonine-protein kinase